MNYSFRYIHKAKMFSLTQIFEFMNLHKFVFGSLTPVLFFTAQVNSQTVNVNNVQLKIPAGMTMSTGGGITIQVGGSIENNGTLNLGGNWTNNGNGLINNGLGIVQFKGSSNQLISGLNTTVFSNLTLDNIADISLNKNTSISKGLVFNHGKINTSINTLSLSTNVTITGAASGKYVNGNLQRDFNTGIAQVSLFPIGDATVYAPVQLDQLNVMTAGTLTASTKPGLAPNENNPLINASGIHQTNRANRYWKLEKGNGFGINNADATFNFAASDVTGNPSNYVVRKFDSPSNWTSTTMGLANSTSTKAIGLQSFSEFEVGETIQNTLSCNGNLQVNNTTGSCSAIISTAQLLSHISYTGSGGTVLNFSPAAGNFTGTTLVTVTLSNINGTLSCSFNVAVHDAESPTVICPPDRTVNTFDDLSSSTLGSALGNDNCSGLVAIMESDLSTQDPNESSTGHNNYTIMRTWTATDLVGNTSQCVQTITVDENAPSIVYCPSDLSINCEDDSNPPTTGIGQGHNLTISYEDLNNQNSDASDIAHYNYQITRTWTGTDVNSNTSQCVQQITVEDNSKPNITCPLSIIINFQDDKSTSANGEATATDNCSSTVNIDSEDATNQNPDVLELAHYNYQITRTWSAIDISGNSSTCIQTITIQDITQPIISCPVFISVSCEADKSPDATGLADANDESSSINLIHSDQSSQSVNPDDIGSFNYQILRTWRATDISGNYNECIQTISILDNTAPTISCPQSQTINCDDDINLINEEAIGTDNCSSVSISFTESNDQDSDPLNSGYYNFVTTRNWNARDITGNVSNCIQSITVQDIVNPKITCPVNQTISCDVNNSPSNIGEAMATDNCSSVLITYMESNSQNPDPMNSAYYNYTITRTWNVTDITGNTSQCIQSITVEDKSNPSITCPEAISVSCDDELSFGKLGSAKSTDNCSPVTIVFSDINTQSAGVNSYGHYNYSISRTWTSTDKSGNFSQCQQSISIHDIKAPILVCPESLVLNCNEDHSLTATGGPATATDNCNSPVSINFSEINTKDSDPANSAYYNYTINRNWIATDISGNTSQCIQIVTIHDVSEPVLTCPVSPTINCQSDKSIEATGGFASASDNCSSIISINHSETSTQGSNPALDDFYNYSITRTWTATDVTGNTSNCDQIITVHDLTDPIITCPQAVTINCNEDNTLLHGIATATDACSSVTINHTDLSFQVANNSDYNHYNYTIQRIWKATNITNHVNTCSQIITVQDITIPTITCPGNKNVNTDPGICGTVVSFNATTSDNCSPVNTTYTQNPGSVFNVGITTVAATATDVSNNFNTCTFTITVTDSEKPKMTCPENKTRGTDAPKCYYTALGNEFNLLTATDNCGITSTSYSLSGITTGSDNNTLDGTIFNKGLTTIKWTLTDAAGNTQTCNYTVTVIDDDKPTVSCPTNKTRGTQSTACTYVTSGAEFNSISSADNCEVATTSYTLSGVTTGTGLNTLNTIVLNKGVTTVSWKVSDVAGNTGTCSFNVTVVDDDNPSISCTANQVRNTTTGACWYSAIGTEFNPIASNDNCGVISTAYTLTGSTIGSGNNTLSDVKFNLGVTTAIWKVSDAAGNTATCSFTVTTKKYADQTLLSAYTILCQNELELKEDIVESGGIGLISGNEKLSLEQNSQVTSANTFVKAQNIEIKTGSTVTTKIFSKVPPGLLPIFIENVNPGNNNKTIADNSAPVTLNLTSYGNLEVGKNVVATFTGNTNVYVKDLKLKEGASLKFSQATNLMINNKVNGDKNIKINPDNIKFIQFYVENDVEFDEGSVVNANIYTQKELHMEKAKSSNRSYMTGLFIADKVESEEYVTWKWNPDYCVEGCPTDPNKTDPGICGCGVVDIDSDCDGISDCNDVCKGGDDTIDNNKDGLPDCKYLPAYKDILSCWKSGSDKVYICHIPSGDPNNTQTLSVSYSAVQAHLNHGDYLGKCGNASCDENEDMVSKGTRSLPVGEVIIDNSDFDLSFQESNMILYPNPAQDILYIKFPVSVNVPIKIQLYNSLGKELSGWIFKASEKEQTIIPVDTKLYTSGLYFIKTSIDGNKQVKSFTILK